MSRSGLERLAGPATLLAIALVTAMPIGAATARSQRPSHRGSAPREVSPPSADAVDLGTLAPPTRLSTLEQTYGDAGYASARVRAQREGDERGVGFASAQVQFPCEPRRAGVGAYRCGPNAGIPGYGLGYSYNPAYVTSPLSSGHDPRDQAPVLTGVTEFFWAINGIIAGHPN